MILLRPLDESHVITQRFGENPQDYPKTNGHMGIDYGADEGNPVRAAADGVPALQIANPGSVAYDTKRDEIIVPN